jgi:hypothetical protein
MHKVNYSLIEKKIEHSLFAAGEGGDRVCGKLSQPLPLTYGVHFFPAVLWYLLKSEAAPAGC